MFAFDGALSAVKCAHANGGRPIAHLRADGVRGVVRARPPDAGRKGICEEIKLQFGSAGEREQMSWLSIGCRHTGFHDKIDMLFRSALLRGPLSYKCAAVYRAKAGSRNHQRNR
jgi:hypothetical protein